MRLFGPIAAGVLVVTFVLLAIVGGGSGESGAELAAGTPAHIAEPDELGELEDSLGREVFWAGERPPDRVELTEEADGSVYLRYLPPGTEPGDPRPDFLTVGTYPVVGALQSILRLARGAGTSVQPVEGGGIVVVNPASSDSVYFALPGSDLQVEVYDPVPGSALRLVRSGAIRPVGEG